MKTTRSIISDYRMECAKSIDVIGDIYRNYSMGLITHREVKSQVLSEVGIMDALRVKCIQSLSENCECNGEKLLESLEESGLLESVAW